MPDDEDKHGVGFMIYVEETQTGHRLPREFLSTWDENLARKTYNELVSRGHQARLVREEFWLIEQTEEYGKLDDKPK